MKKIIYTLLLCLVAIGMSFAQAPGAFKYQSVVRDNLGGIIANQVVKFRITLLRGSMAGTTSYIEQHTTATNQFGIANLEIGNGSSPIGNIDTIQWGKADYFIKIELDPTGSSGYTVMGTTQLLSVPYALYAEKSKKALNDNDTSATNELQTLSLAGNTLSISNGNSVNLGVIPSGCIMSFAGVATPGGWLICDGSAVSRTTYSNLYASIGNAYGSGDGSTTFNLPDMRGRFLRGVDGVAGNDPDKTTRIASNSGGNIGNNIGSLQSDTIQAHNHNLLINVFISTYNGVNDATYLSGHTSGSDSFWAGTYNTANYVSIENKGGSETRPVNVYVNYIIKY